MSLINPDILRAKVAKPKRLLCLDLGSNTIGLALSDITWHIASPLETIYRTKFGIDSQNLFDLMDKYSIGGFVVGLPINMDGTEGPRCQSTRAFITNILKFRNIPIVLHDERLSTAAIQRMLIDEMDTSRKRRAAIVDKLAATYILQGFLDYLKFKK